MSGRHGKKADITSVIGCMHVGVIDFMLRVFCRNCFSLNYYVIAFVIRNICLLHVKIKCIVRKAASDAKRVAINRSSQPLSHNSFLGPG